jgi:hypothetical protein
MTPGPAALPHDAMTLREASAELGIDEASLSRLAAERRIPCVQVEGHWVFSRKSIAKWRLSQGRRGSG